MKKNYILILIYALALSLVVAGVALANGSVDLPWQVVSGGATDSAAGNITLRATLGQSVVGVASAGGVTLGQGFWHGGAAAGGEHEIYLPLVLRKSDMTTISPTSKNQ